MTGACAASSTATAASHSITAAGSYGGFWQRLPRALRPGIRIDGGPLLALDFKAMFVQLLYAVMARQQPPHDGDAYADIEPRTAGRRMPIGRLRCAMR